MTRTAGAPIGCQRPSRFWGLGCPKIYHEAEDTLVVFTERLPVEPGEPRIVLGGIVFALQFQFRQANGLEALRHLGHVTFEQAHGHGRAVLKQVTGPGEGIRVEGIGGAPHGGTAGGVDNAHFRTSVLCGAFPVTPVQVPQ
ncbi:hypothetical protein, partial [Thiolapillus sp.]|uniref:hypothetical protein n=1 Tax=Thiolapillus sp. TaxID=2017437 RepID=UPI003AF82C19